MVQEMKPQLTRRQASNQLDRRILPIEHAKGKLKKGTVKAQATSTERSAITFDSQKRWYDFVTALFNKARVDNTGVCKVTGKTYGELMRHFVIGLDEECIMADSAGNIRIIGSGERKKHEKIVADRCVP